MKLARIAPLLLAATITIAPATARGAITIGAGPARGTDRAGVTWYVGAHVEARLSDHRAGAVEVGSGMR